MIVFELKCVCGFQFEGWFQDRNDYETQFQEGELFCPECNGQQVHKILSPVAGCRRLLSAEAEAPSTGVVAGEVEAGRKILENLQNYVEKNFDDVGSRLAEESLKMHYGVTEQRNIRGTTSEEQEKILKKEGIELLKIPMPAKKEKKKLD